MATSAATIRLQSAGETVSLYRFSCSSSACSRQKERTMAGKLGRVIRILAVVGAGILPLVATKAQSGGADSLEGQIAQQYKLTKLGTDSSGTSVIQTGTVLVIKKGGILSVTQADAGLLANVVKDGDVQSPAAALVKTKKDRKFLPVGDNVYVSKA